MKTRDGVQLLLHVIQVSQVHQGRKHYLWAKQELVLLRLLLFPTALGSPTGTARRDWTEQLHSRAALGFVSTIAGRHSRAALSTAREKGKDTQDKEHRCPEPVFLEI